MPKFRVHGKIITTTIVDEEVEADDADTAYDLVMDHTSCCQGEDDIQVVAEENK